MPSEPNTFMRDTAREIFQHALEQASIPKAFARNVHCERGILRICEDLYDLNAYGRVLVVSIGKADTRWSRAWRRKEARGLRGSLPPLWIRLRKCMASATFVGDIPPPMSYSVGAPERSQTH